LSSPLNLSPHYSQKVSSLWSFFWLDKPGNTIWRGWLSTVDLLIIAYCFVAKEDNIFNIKMSLSKLFSTRRSPVLSLPLQ
jgi:hypothetical protein